MAISAYSKTTYVNGTTPAINATNLNNIEQQVADITSAATADGASPTKIWTSTNDGNGGQPPAPKPRDSASNIGHWTNSIIDSVAASWINPGGVWAYWGEKRQSLTGAFAAVYSGVTTGNITGLGSNDYTLALLLWRIA